MWSSVDKQTLESHKQYVNLLYECLVICDKLFKLPELFTLHNMTYYCVFFVYRAVVDCIRFVLLSFYLSVLYVFMYKSQAAQSRCTVVRPVQKSIGNWKFDPL